MATLEITSIIVWLVIGGLAGWIAGLIVTGYGFGLIGNIAVGIIGAVIAGILFHAIGIMPDGGFLRALISSIVGAVILLLIIGLIRRNA